MSVSIMWAPTEDGQCAGGLSSNVEILERAFGNVPITLTNCHIQKLMGISAAQPGEDLWRSLINAIQRHKQIRVWTEY